MKTTNHICENCPNASEGACWQECTPAPAEDFKSKLAKAEAEMYAANYVAMSVQDDNASSHAHIEQALEYAEMCAQKVARLREAAQAAQDIDQCLNCGDQFPGASSICARCAQYEL